MADPLLRFPVHPRYGEASGIDLLPSVLAALGIPGVGDPFGFATRHDGLRRAVVLLVDGLGFHQLEAAATVSPTLADLRSGRFGSVERLTTGFPSTTPTSLVGIGTGLPPGMHGILGFTLRVPGENRVLNHVQWRDHPPPSIWQPMPTMFEIANAAGVATRVVSNAAFAGSGLTDSAYRGARYIGGDGIETLADTMIDALTEPSGPTLVYGYHADVDRAGHAHGPGSDEWLDEIRRLERLLARLAARLPGDAALFVTADHGQLTVPVDDRFDLDTDPRLRAGVEIVAGEPRVRYLHTRRVGDPADPRRVDDVVAAWRGVLGAAAVVMTRDEAVATGWYGEVTPTNRERLGDVVVICRDRHAIMMSRIEPHEMAMVGMHGSLTAVEMEIPLITLRW